LQASQDLSDDDEAIFTIKTIVGTRDPKIELFARKIVEITSKVSKKPVIISLGLKDLSSPCLRSICSIIQNNIDIFGKI
jgi:hypothetical protein